MTHKKSTRRSKPLGEAALWEYALRLLSARGYSAGDLQRKLRPKASSAPDLDRVMSRLKEYGYVDDRKFAEHYAAARVENQGFGQARVLSDLSRKGVPAAVAREAVEKIFGATDETTLIEQYLRRKYKNTPLEEYLAIPKNLNSAYRRLRYAGFSGRASIDVLRRFSSRAEELTLLDEDPE